MSEEPPESVPLDDIWEAELSSTTFALGSPSSDGDDSTLGEELVPWERLTHEERQVLAGLGISVPGMLDSPTTANASPCTFDTNSTPEVYSSKNESIGPVAESDATSSKCCPVCHTNFPDSCRRYNFQRHVTSCRRKALKRKPENICSICNKKFSSKSHFTRHLLCHLNIKRFVCPVCNKKFAQKKDLDRHSLSHEPDSVTRMYSCEDCPDLSGFKSDAELKRHRSLVHAPCFYPCNICDESFRTRLEYQTHYEWHAGDREHGCDFCSKRFREKCDLDKHRRQVHSRTPAYQCSICRDNFVQRVQMDRHLSSQHRLPPKWTPQTNKEIDATPSRTRCRDSPTKTLREQEEEEEREGDDEDVGMDDQWDTATASCSPEVTASAVQDAISEAISSGTIVPVNNSISHHQQQSQANYTIVCELCQEEAKQQQPDDEQNTSPTVDSGNVHTTDNVTGEPAGNSLESTDSCSDKTCTQSDSGGRSVRNKCGNLANNDDDDDDDDTSSQSEKGDSHSHGGLHSNVTVFTTSGACGNRLDSNRISDSGHYYSAGRPHHHNLSGTLTSCIQHMCSEYASHLKIVHQVPSAAVCRYCFAWFRGDTAVERHIARQHWSRIHLCPDCQKRHGTGIACENIDQS